LPGEERTSLQPDNCFATAPYASCAGGVTGDDEHVRAIAGNAAMSPDTAFSSRCRPGGHAGGRVIYLHPHYPPVITTAIAVPSGVRHVHDPVHNGQCTAFFLD